ncbi:hypothetical protein RSOLAG1IB_09242 [Rhizoctonia solani AG-1 IB]|uniref:Uncharacterized protein n=1 Tax=Thanatephorus cucumeris (strain AG1-IB / isolate 7/3/14) TaxID=1108050 RepID=A0A0B7FQM2_THACB|nr:hypothetical protein RSOLAG1IB_09242 [Rhizoctonia solani AG-1 IB]
MSGDGCECKLKLNPDITGVGVRVALYVQILLGWLTSFYWRDTFARNSRTAYMTATALLIASFIELTTQELSLLDGLVVSLITTMMITFALASYSVGSPGSTNNGNRGLEQIGSPTRWFMQLCFVVFWGAWGFHMWRDPAHFGLKGDAVNCETNYNVTLQLFTEVRPTDPGVRAAALSLISIGFVLAILSLFFSLEECLVFVSRPFEQCGKRCGKRNGKNGDNGDNGEIGSGRDSGKDGENQEINARGMTTPLYDKPLLQGIHVFLQAIAIATYVFLIYAIEQTINKNDVDGTTRDWSYGQTIALILLLQQFMDLCSNYIEDREKKEEEEERQANANGDTTFSHLPLALTPQPPLPRNDTGLQ